MTYHLDNHLHLEPMWSWGSGPWMLRCGDIEVTVPGLRNRLGGHPPRPKQKNIDRAIAKVERLRAEQKAAEADEQVEHANFVHDARDELNAPFDGFPGKGYPHD